MNGTIKDVFIELGNFISMGLGFGLKQQSPGLRLAT